MPRYSLRALNPIARPKTSIVRLALLFAVAVYAVPAVAEANFVYWTNQGGTTIGRAKLNGTGINNSFIAGLNDPHGIAVDSKYIYWSQGNAATGSIGRANLDGTGANPNFIPHSAGVDSPFGVAVTSSALFWSNAAATIGRAGLDGTGAVSNFIAAPGSICGLAADANFVYWLSDASGNKIGRATVTNSSVNPDFITGITSNCGVAVDPSFVYWGSDASSIGRATIGGTGANNSFIPAASAGDPCGVAVNPQYVFWGNPPAAIGRANLKGTGSNPGFVSGPTGVCLVAAAPSNKVTFGTTSRNKKKGTAKLTGKVSGPGLVQVANTPATASAAAPTVKTVGLTLGAAGSFTLPVKPKGKAAKALKKKGKTKVKVFVTFIPAGVAGVANPVKREITLVKNKKKKKKK